MQFIVLNKLFDFFHVVDEYLFYEFYVDEDDDDSSDDSGCAEFAEDKIVATNLQLQLTDIEESGVQKEARAFRDAIDVRDRRFHLTMYSKVFVGCGKCEKELFSLFHV